MYKENKSSKLAKAILRKYDTNKEFRLCINVLLSGIVSAVLLILYVKNVGLYFGINDDIAISKLIAGTSGMNEGYSVYINFIPSYILSKLSLIFSGKNWYGIYLFVSYFIAISVIVGVYLDKFKIKLTSGIFLLLSICVFLPVLRYFTFTYVSYISLVAAIVLIVYTYQKDYSKKFKLILYILGSLIFINGSLIRYKCIYTVGLLLGGYVIIKAIIDKKNAVTLVVVSMMTLILCIGLRQFHLYQYNKDEVWKEYLEFNTYRSKLIDYGLPEYEANEEFYKSIEWSANDYAIFSSYKFPDDNKFSTETLKKIHDYGKGLREQKVNIKEIVNEIYNFSLSKINVTITILLLFGMGIYNLFFAKEKLLSFLLIVFPFIIHSLFIIVGRAPERVTYPHYFISVILLLVIGEYFSVDTEDEKIKIRNNKGVLSILVFSISIFVLYGYKPIIDRYKLNEENVISEELNRAVQIYWHLRGNTENIYLTDLNYNYGTMYEKTIFVGYDKDSESNIISIGGWRSRSKNWIDIKKNNNISLLMLDLLNKQNYYFVSQNDQFVNWFGVYFKETYGIDIKCEIVDQMFDTKIYKVQEVIEEQAEINLSDFNQ